VSGFSQGLIARSGYGLEGFADEYDRYRPAPPPIVLELIGLLARSERPRLVVDIGAGTGLSTRAWSERADEVVGVDANPRMVERARAATEAANVRYVESYASDTGTAAGAADAVTCSQAFHWMDPREVLPEAARILRPGGVFAAYDYDVPPVVHPELDAAFDALGAARGAARRRLGLEPGAATWPKSGHLASIRDSGLFGTARELVCHASSAVDAERFVGLAATIGGPLSKFDAEPEVRARFEELREAARRVLGDGRRRMVLGYRIRAGLR
jgi:SAM-dependent methyltransferase